jgi:hypothetical protein
MKDHVLSVWSHDPTVMGHLEIGNLYMSHHLDDILRCGVYGTFAMAYHEM